MNPGHHSFLSEINRLREKEIKCRFVLNAVEKCLNERLFPRGIEFKVEAFMRRDQEFVRGLELGFKTGDKLASFLTEGEHNVFKTIVFLVLNEEVKNSFYANSLLGNNVSDTSERTGTAAVSLVDDLTKTLKELEVKRAEAAKCIVNQNQLVTNVIDSLFDQSDNVQEKFRSIEKKLTESGLLGGSGGAEALLRLEECIKKKVAEDEADLDLLEAQLAPLKEMTEEDRDLYQKMVKEYNATKQEIKRLEFVVKELEEADKDW